MDKKTLVDYIEPASQERIAWGLKALQNTCHRIASEKGFWLKDRAMRLAVDGGTPTDLNQHTKFSIISTKISLIMTELAEAVEGMRAGNPPSDKLHEWGISQVEEELADAVIRILDLAGEFEFNIPNTILKKLQYNTQREHLHGKKF